MPKRKAFVHRPNTQARIRIRRHLSSHTRNPKCYQFEFLKKFFVKIMVLLSKTYLKYLRHGFSNLFGDT